MHPPFVSPKWTQRFLELAELVATWSKDPSTKCGAVVVNWRRRVVGLGYNGFPDRVEDRADYYADRDIKLGLVIHAEVNAILNAIGPVDGCTLFVTGPPCHDCAKFVVQAGIAQVYYRNPIAPDQVSFAKRWADKIEQAQRVFEAGNVDVFGVG
jgi:dCMP deaminase